MSTKPQTLIAEKFISSTGDLNKSFGMGSQTKICDQNCPAENQKDEYSIDCRQCKQQFHLPCFDIVQTKNRLFATKNVVFMCDDCLKSIDDIKSPKRKQALPATNETPKIHIRQPQLVPNASGILSLSATSVIEEKS